MTTVVEPRFDPTCCAVCGSAAADPVFEHRGRSFTSDGRTIDRPILKVQCRTCGAARRGDPFDEPERTRHYGADYELAVRAAAAEPLFFTESGVVPRSLMIADWLQEELARVRGAAPANVLEVGCGEGAVLAHLARGWPGARVEGIDLGAATRRDGFEIRQGSYVDVTGPFDLIYAFAVIEHVASPRHFLDHLGGRLSPAGRLAIALPRVDSGSRDVLFYDHLHHLLDVHVASLARSAGLRPRGSSIGRGPMSDFALHVFERASTRSPAMTSDADRAASRIRQTVETWKRRWRALDEWLVAIGNAPLVVWGLGEGFGLLRTYSTLGDRSIAVGLDDNPARFAAASWPFAVRRLEDLTPDECHGAIVLLTFTPARTVLQRLSARELPWFNALSGETCSC